MPRSRPPCGICTLGRNRRAWAVALALAAAGLWWIPTAVAQNLTPRAYWPAPKGIKVAVVGYSYATGDVLFDPSIPLYGVDSSINAGLVAYLQTFSLWGRTTNILVELPYSWGTTQGQLFADPARRDFSGLGDLGVTLAINLLGAPSMTPAQFQELRTNPHPILGASLKVVAPTGRYDSDRLINVGGKRWAAKAELGYMIPFRPKWLLELEAGAWFFGDDDDFLPGKREQEPVYAGQIHLVQAVQARFLGVARRHLLHRRPANHRRESAWRRATELEARRDGRGALSRSPRHQGRLQQGCGYRVWHRLPTVHCELSDGLQVGLGPGVFCRPSVDSSTDKRRTK